MFTQPALGLAWQYGPVEPAHSALKRLIRDELGPRLRLLGFTGSGGVYQLPAPEHIAQLGVQKWRYNSVDEARFTVHASVISVAGWAALRQKSPWITATKPSPNAHYGCDGPWIERVSHLLPGHRAHEDPWWSVVPGQSLAAVAEEVAGAVAAYALPAMRRRMGPSQSHG